MVIRILNHATSGGWAEVATSEDHSLLTDAFTGVMTSDHLTALTGLGTSLCIVDEDGARMGPTMDDLWVHVEAETGEAFSECVQLVGYQTDGHDKDIETFLSQCQSYLDLHDDDDVRAFVGRAEQAIAARCRFLTSGETLDVHRTFLTRLSRRPHQKGRFRMFTTNYDLAFEYAAGAAGLVIVDGFEYTKPHAFNSAQFDYDIVRRVSHAETAEYLPGLFYLYKLHGSIDWEQQASSAVKVPGTGSPLLIYPRASKFQLSYKFPFFDLLAAFQEQLRRPNVGVVIAGFGFSDLHIVQPILGAIRSNHSLSMVVIDPCLEERPPEAVKRLERLIRAGDPRITLVAGTFEEVSPHIPLLHADTYGEIHTRRMGMVDFS